MRTFPKPGSPNLSKSTSYGQIQYGKPLTVAAPRFGDFVQNIVLDQKNVRTMDETQVERSACMEGSEVEVCNHQRPPSANPAC